MKPLPRLLLIVLLLSAGKTSLAAALSLEEAMERAIRVNPAIQSKEVEVERQTLEQEIARGQRMPQIDLDADYTHHGYPYLITPIREAGVFPPLDRDIARIGAALRLPLYAGGKLVAGEAFAAHNREASVHALRADGQDLLYNVVATYAKALHFRQLGKALDVRIKALEREERDIGLRIREGRAARLELIRLQTQLSQARYDQVSVVQAEQDALSLLAALLGESGPLPELAEIGVTAPGLPASQDVAQTRALEQRPDLMRLDAVGKAAEQKTAMARGERLPRVDLVARAQESAGSDWKGYDDWQLGVQMSLPVFDGGVRRRRVEQASLAERQNTLQQMDTRNRIAGEVEQAFGALSESHARLQVAVQNEVEADEALRIERLRYQSGENTITDLLDAEAALWSAIARRLQAGYDIVVSQARLLRAVGELDADSFKPAPMGDPGKAVAPVPAADVAILAPYFAWHRCGFVCDTPPKTQTAGWNTHAANTHCHDAGAAKRLRNTLEQGARSCKKGS